MKEERASQIDIEREREREREIERDREREKPLHIHPAKVVVQSSSTHQQRIGGALEALSSAPYPNMTGDMDVLSPAQGNGIEMAVPPIPEHVRGL